MLLSFGLGFKVHRSVRCGRTTNTGFVSFPFLCSRLWHLLQNPIQQCLKPGKSYKQTNTSWSQKGFGADPRPICKICCFSLKTKRKHLDQRRGGEAEALRPTQSSFAFERAFLFFLSAIEKKALTRGLLTRTAIYRCVNKRPFYH